MRRKSIRRLPIVALLLFGVVFGVLTTAVRAQESTPSATTAITINQIAPGVTAEVFAAAHSLLAPGETVYTVRFVFRPGAAIFPHSHPGTTVLGVVSGSFGWTLQAGVAHVVRGATGTIPGAVQDLTVAGTDVVLEPGDAIYHESDVIHTARGAGDTPAVVAGSLVLKMGAPLLMPANMNLGAPTP